MLGAAVGAPNRTFRAMRDLEFQMSRVEFAAAVCSAARQLGENLGCTARLIAAWEDGDVACPRTAYRRVLTQMTGRSMVELGFQPPVPGVQSRPSLVSSPRRAFLLDGAGVALALPVAARQQAPGRVGASDVRAVTKAVAMIYAHDHDHGSAPLRRAATEALHTAYRWLQDGTYSDRTGRQLRAATGFLSIAVGWLSYDSGRPADARSLYSEAQAAARIAGHVQLEAHTFGCMSLLARASGRPREAISAAQGAQSVARTYGSPRLLSLMALREAGGWALLGDRSATDQAIVRSHRLYAQGPKGADPEWLDFFTPAELAGLEALARADLAQHDRAAAGAEQAVLLHGEHFTRNRALYQADVAIQHALRDRPEPEAAAAAAGQVLTYLPAVRSDRLLQQLHNVDTALQRHAAIPAVADWREAYRHAIGS